MLLSIIDLIEKGEITTNEIQPSIRITETFLKYWSDLNVVTHNPTLHLPFYHLSGDGFWHLHPNEGHELALKHIRTVKTFTQLKNVVHHASLDDELFALLMEEQNRHAFRKLILDTYFPGTSSSELSGDFQYVASFQTASFVAEGTEPYQSGIWRTAEQQRRALSFRNSIMSLYDFTCSMCRRRVITLDGETIVDAAHIIPFSESRNDNVTNGFSLCKNHHWIFDRGLISVDEDYRVLISPKLDTNSIVTIDLEGRKIMLPGIPKCNPAIESFDWHRTNIFYQ